MSSSPRIIVVVAAVIVVAVAAFTLMNRPAEEPADTSPPTADVGPDVSVLVGESFVLDGSRSVDDRALSGFEWRLGDGSTKTGSTVAHSYGEAGVYTVTLTWWMRRVTRGRTH
jgi:chitodextrinase